MFDILRNLTWWHWWIAAAVLAAAETFLSGAIAIWFGVAALAIGAMLLVMPVPWQLQWVLFAVFGTVALLVWRRVKDPEKGDSTQPTLNQRGVHYIGQVFTLVEPIVSGIGKIQVGDSVWLAHGIDAPLGARVRVVGVDGTVLKVEST